MRNGSIRTGLGRALWAGALGVALLAASCSSDKKAADSTPASTTPVAATPAPTDPPAPSDPPATEATEPPATEPTDPPETEPTDPPETEPTDPPKTDPTDPPATDPPDDEPAEMTFSECDAIIEPLTFATVDQAAGCDWSGGPLRCDTGTAAFRAVRQDMICRTAPQFDLGIYAGGAYTTDWFEIGHQGGVLDEVTGEPGLSYFAIQLASLGEVPGTFIVSANCGGRLVTGAAPFSPFETANVQVPLFAFGPCILEEIIAQLDSGIQRALDPTVFGDNGGSFVVDEAEFQLRTEQMDSFIEEFSGSVVGGPQGTLLEPGPGPLGNPRSTLATILGLTSNSPIGCIDVHLISGAVGTIPCADDPDTAEWTIELVEQIAAELTSTPIAQSFGSIVQIGTTDIISAPHEIFLQCGPGPLGFTICPEGEPPLDTTGFVVASVTFDAIIDPNAPPSDIALTWPGGRIQVGSLMTGENPTNARFLWRGETGVVFIPVEEITEPVPPGGFVFSIGGTPLTSVGEPAARVPFIVIGE